MNKTGDGKTQTPRRSRTHRSLAERTVLINDYRASGLTQEQFAARAGINLSTLRAWIYRKPSSASHGRSHFAPVRVLDGGAPLTKSPGRGVVTVRWPQGVAVEIAVELDPLGALHVIRELLSPCLR